MDKYFFRYMSAASRGWDEETIRRYMEDCERKDRIAEYERSKADTSTAGSNREIPKA